jgi:hypothetical protein
MEEFGVDEAALERALEEDDVGALEAIKGSLSGEQVEDLLTSSLDSVQDAPAWVHMDLQGGLLPRQTWLVHFSDHAVAIKREGFQYGVDVLALDRLAFTRGWRNGPGVGYNFAYLAGGVHAARAAEAGFYGRDAVMFRSSGVSAYHYGDEEVQVVFYGPDVRPEEMVLLVREDEAHCVVGRGGRRLVCGEFGRVVGWVMDNFVQYRGAF